MKHAIPADTATLGADLRALRKARGLTLVDMAARLDKSVGWLSQVERDISSPGIADLRKMAALLEVSVSSLFRANAVTEEAGLIVRRDARRPLGDRTEGLVEELLSPDLTDDFEMIHSVFAAGAALAEPVARPTQEVGYVVSGKLDLTIDDNLFHLNPGDSFRIRGERFLWANPSDHPCTVIWVIAPPVY